MGTDTEARASHDGEAFADGTPLVELFGESGKTRLLAALVDERQRELSVSELARQAGVSRSTVYDHVDELVAMGAAERHEARQGDRFTLADSELGELLYQVDGVALRNLLDAENAS